MIDPRLYTDVAQAEGCRLLAYRDSLGYWTLGYGHLLTPIDHDWTGTACTQEQAETWLNDDLTQAQNQAENLSEWDQLDTDCRRNAITELVFNLGLTKWEKFIRTRDALEKQDWLTAAAQLMQSAWAIQVGSQRANRLHDYILSGEYP